MDFAKIVVDYCKVGNRGNKSNDVVCVAYVAILMKLSICKDGGWVCIICHPSN